MNQRATSFVFGLSLILCVGCGSAEVDKFTSKRPKTFPASGTVKLNGQPVAGATVVFAPDPGDAPNSIAATAMTQASGDFSLQAYPPLKGAVPGKYKVTISKMELPAPAAKGPNAHDAPPPPPPRSLIPENYADPEKSGLIADIPEDGRNDLHFDLK